MTSIRPITPADLALICHHRSTMFSEAGRPASDITAMSEPFASWLKPRLEDGRYFGFIAEHPLGTPIGGIGLMAIDWPPHPDHPDIDQRGYVLNVFVEPAHRGQGIARTLMEKADQTFQDRNLTYSILHATDAGRLLYEKLGWKQTAEMAKAQPVRKDTQADQSSRSAS